MEMEQREKQLNEISYMMILAANQLMKDGHDELGHDLDDMRARLLSIRSEVGKREADLLETLKRVVNGATGTKGRNSLERDYAHITQNVLDLGRETLRKYGVEGVSERTELSGRFAGRGA